MAKLLRLVYVSRACFDLNHESNSIDRDVSDIIIKARKNNQSSSIGGVLYFANGYFFQCLEGKESSVNQLFETIKQDLRHTDLKITYCKSIRRRMFASWTMKYVPVTQEVNDLVSELGYSNFNPTEFSESDVNLVVDLFTRLDDSSLKDDKMRECYRLEISWWKNIVQRFAF